MEPSTGAMAISKTRWAARRTWAGATSPNSCSRPGNYQGNRKSDHNERNHQTHDPVRNFQEREDLSCDLNREPTDNRIRDRDLVNVAPFQLGQEVAVHGIRVGLRFERREISEIIEVCILTLGHSCSRRTHASYP